MYTFTYNDGAGTVYEMVLYAGCMQTAKSNAHVESCFLTTARTFWRVTGKWGDVAEQITVNQSDDVADVLSDTESKIGKVDHEDAGVHGTGIDDSSYLNADYGFSVSWDEEIWIATELDHDNHQGSSLAPAPFWSRSARSFTICHLIGACRRWLLESLRATGLTSLRSHQRDSNDPGSRMMRLANSTRTTTRRPVPKR